MADTPDAMTLYDEQRTDRDEGHVNISSAQREFKELSRQLSRQSQRKNSTRTASVDSDHDVEKGAIEEPDTFDLRDYLTSSNDANQQAGIQHKV